MLVELNNDHNLRELNNEFDFSFLVNAGSTKVERE